MECRNLELPIGRPFQLNVSNSTKGYPGSGFDLIPFGKVKGTTLIFRHDAASISNMTSSHAMLTCYSVTLLHRATGISPRGSFFIPRFPGGVPDGKFLGMQSRAMVPRRVASKLKTNIYCAQPSFLMCCYSLMKLKHQPAKFEFRI